MKSANVDINIVHCVACILSRDLLPVPQPNKVKVPLGFSNSNKNYLSLLSRYCYRFAVLSKFNTYINYSVKFRLLTDYVCLYRKLVAKNLFLNHIHKSNLKIPNRLLIILNSIIKQTYQYVISLLIFYARLSRFISGR